jgi:Na+-translocating ferredoxin:NAD+ oxidoreductase RnfG subunit
MLFPRSALEVAEDAWMNLFHHTLAFLVLGGLLVRTSAPPRVKAGLAVLFGAGTLGTALGPALIRWGVPGAAVTYVATLTLLSGIAVVNCTLVWREALWRRAGHRGIRGSDVLARAGALTLLLTLAVTIGLAAQQLMTEEQALHKVFPDVMRVTTDTLRPDSAARAELERQLGRSLYESEFVVRGVYGPRDVPLGYAMVTEERGKYRPITMLVGVDTLGRVTGVQILVYRESRGGEVARDYFLRQYRGKTVGDPIRLNRDIINISGATISVHSVNAGVKKALAVIAWARRTKEHP